MPNTYLPAMNNTHQLHIEFGLSLEMMELAARDGVTHLREGPLQLCRRELIAWARKHGHAIDTDPASQFGRALQMRLAAKLTRDNPSQLAWHLAANHRDIRGHLTGRTLYAHWLNREFGVELRRLKLNPQKIYHIDEACDLLGMSWRELVGERGSTHHGKSSSAGLIDQTKGPNRVDGLYIAHRLYWNKRREEEATAKDPTPKLSCTPARA